MSVEITKSTGCKGWMNSVRDIVLYLSENKIRPRRPLDSSPRSLYTVCKFTFNSGKIVVKDSNVGSLWIFVSLRYSKCDSQYLVANKLSV